VEEEGNYKIMDGKAKKVGETGVENSGTLESERENLIKYLIRFGILGGLAVYIIFIIFLFCCLVALFIV